MTLRELMDVAGHHPLVLVALFLVPPLAAWIAGLIHGKGGGAPIAGDGGENKCRIRGTS